MNILINASNLKIGGGLQVADSLINELCKVSKHHYIVVYPTALEDNIRRINGNHIEAVCYNMNKSVGGVISGKNPFLDKLVTDRKVDAVLTIFGPSFWRPAVFHLCGFAQAYCLLYDSPFWKKLNLRQFAEKMIKSLALSLAFYRSAKFFFTENEYISKKLRSFFHNENIFTITNTYNQFFDDESQWMNNIYLPDFTGTTILSVSNYALHKNLDIIRVAIKYLKKYHPEYRFRFVLTIEQQCFAEMTDLEKQHILFLGTVDMRECPNLYRQADVMLMPSLLECFSATYAEAMRMRVPIITTDLDFARSICGAAAVYYSPIDGSDLGEKLFRLSNDESLIEDLKDKGIKQLKKFDSPASRARKLIDIIQKQANKTL